MRGLEQSLVLTCFISFELIPTKCIKNATIGGGGSCLNIACLKKIPISAAFTGMVSVLQEFTLKLRHV